MRKIALGILTLLVLLGVGLVYGPAAAAPAKAFPKTIALPEGFQPEGVVVGRGPIIYAGSLADGDIYRASLRTGEGEVFIQGTGAPAVGLAYDARSNYLFVSGGPAGVARVYDASTGALLQTYVLSSEHSFINDAIVTRQAVYFTNSFQPELYRIPLGPAGRLPAPGAVETIPLSGPAYFDPVPPPNFIFYTNGIEAMPNGRYLIVVNTTRQALYRVDSRTGESALIDIGGPIPFGDGLVLQGKMLYVVQNQLSQISAIRLSPDLLSGQVVKTITDPDFNVPTTAALFGSRLYAVNAKFGTPPAGTPYEIVQVRR